MTRAIEQDAEAIVESESVRQRRIQFEQDFERLSLEDRERLIEKWAAQDRQSRKAVK